MESWKYSKNIVAQVALACVSCDKVVLFKMKPEILGPPPLVVENIFLLTFCFTCETDEKKKFATWGSSRDVPAAGWMPLSISVEMLRMWEPYFAMAAFFEGNISLPKTKLSLVHRDEVRDKAGTSYQIQSVKLNPEAGVAALPDPYLESGFF
jgi:hypothetical protein